MKKTLLISVTAILLVLVALLVVQKRTSTGFTPPKGLETTLLPQPKQLDDFSLVDQNGKPFGPARLRGSWSFLFFGYTHCPDICPTTLATLQRFSHHLKQNDPKIAADTQYVFISVDPKRDPPDHLKTYLRYFNPDFLGATGKKAQIDALVGQVGAGYAFEGDVSSDNYIVNHSATLYLVDPSGRYVARFFPPHTVDELLETYRRVREFHG